MGAPWGLPLPIPSLRGSGSPAHLLLPCLVVPPPCLAGDKKQFLPLCFLFKDGWGGGESIGTHEVWGRLWVSAGVAARWQCGGHCPLCLVPGAVSASPLSALVSSLLPAPTPKTRLGPTLDLGSSRAREPELEPRSPPPAMWRWVHLRAFWAAESARNRPTEAVQGIIFSPCRHEAQAPGCCSPLRDI